MKMRMRPKMYSWECREDNNESVRYEITSGGRMGADIRERARFVGYERL